MPIYDYKCGECGTTSEILKHGIDEGVVYCPECGSGDMERLLTASYAIRTESRAPGTTCCGRTDRCDTPPCDGGRSCCGSG